MQQKSYTYLALGDSYTIGEGIPLHENFPNQTVNLLIKAGYSVSEPTIVAKTGWTTKELQDGVAGLSPGHSYDIVSLLIGVNNQYRGEDLHEYEKQFDELLKQSISSASNKPSHVFVLSIPDWSVTPYAKGRNRDKISTEIDALNRINKRLSKKLQVNYIDITSGSRDAAKDHSLIASDGLHPSPGEYSRWAEKLATLIQQQLK